MDDPTVVEVPAPVEAPPGAPALRFGKRYRSLALLGSGGMGSVYLARDEELGELVAVKVLRSELVDHPDMLERFRDEVRLARLVSSPLALRLRAYRTRRLRRPRGGSRGRRRSPRSQAG